MVVSKLKNRETQISEFEPSETSDGKINFVQEPETRKFEYVWRSIIALAILHALAFYGLWLVLSGQAMAKTFFYGREKYKI